MACLGALADDRKSKVINCEASSTRRGNKGYGRLYKKRCSVEVEPEYNTRIFKPFLGTHSFQVNIVVASVDGRMADDQVRTSSMVALETPKGRSS